MPDPQSPEPAPSVESPVRASGPALAAYGLPALALTMLAVPLLVYLPAFYSQEIGLSLSLTGLIFFLARAWDGIIDPLVGTLSDRTRTRWGARRPWMLAGMPLLICAIWFVSTPPDGAGPLYLLVWLFLLYVALTMVQVPFLAWGAEISPDYRERNRIAAFREFYVLFGALLAAIIPLVLLPGEKATLGNTLTVYAQSILILVPLGLGVAFLFGAREDTRLAGRASTSWRGAWRSVVINGPFMRLLLAVFLMALAYAIFNSVMVLLIDHGLMLPGAFLKLLFVKQLVAILCIPLCLKFANRFGKHKTLAVGGLVMALAFIALYFGRSASPMMAYAGFAIVGAAASPLVTIPPSLMADVADYGTLKTGKTSLGAYYAVFGMVQKMAYAMGVAIGLGTLDLLDFAPKIRPEASADAVTATALIAPTVIISVGALLFWAFPITLQRHEAIKRRLLHKDRARVAPANQEGSL